jgi:hypothetical protein
MTSSFKLASFRFRPGGALLKVAPWSGGLSLVPLLSGLQALGDGGGMFLSFLVATGVIASPAALWLFRARERRGETLTVGEKQIQVSRVLERFALEEVVRAEARGSEGLLVQFQDGAEIEGKLEGARPEEVLEALHYDPKTRVVRVPRKGFPNSMFFGIVSLLVVPILAFQPLAALADRLGEARDHVGLLLLASFLVGCAVALLGGKRLDRRGFELSLDGIRVVNFWGQTFLPRSQVVRFEEVERRGVVEYDADDEAKDRPLYASQERVTLVGFRVHLRSGKSILLDGLPPDRLVQVRGALVRLIAPGGSRPGQASWEAHRASLARGSSEAAAWLRELRERYGSTATYREDRVPEADLEDCLNDASAPPDLRLAAAVALRASGKGARKKIRVAAESCANPELAKALLAAREEELDEELVEAVERQAGRR